MARGRGREKRKGIEMGGLGDVLASSENPIFSFKTGKTHHPVLSLLILSKKTITQPNPNI